MSRDFRFKVSGLIFFFVTFLHLVFSEGGKSFTTKILSNPDQLQVIITVASGALIFFASDAIGYLFNSVFIFFFNIVAGGYNGIYEREFGDLNEYLLKFIENNHPATEETQRIFDRIQDCNTEQKFVYYFWNGEKEASDHLKQWIDRRYTAYFTSYGTVLAVVIASIVSIILFNALNIVPNNANIVISIISVMFIGITIYSGERAMKDAINIHKLHLANYLDPGKK